MGKPLDLLTQAVGVKFFYGIDDTRVDIAAAFVQNPAVGDILGQGVLEGVLQVGKKLRRVEKLGSLQIVEQRAKPVFCQTRNCLQQGDWDVVPNHRRRLQQAFFGSRQSVDTRG